MMRPCHILLIVLLLLFTGFGGLYFHGQRAYGRGIQHRQDRLLVGKALGLGHLILNTEAPFLRHFGYGPPAGAFNGVLCGLDLTLGGAFLLPPGASAGHAGSNTSYGN